MQTIGILIGGFVSVYLAMAIAHLRQRSRDWAMRSQLALATMRQQFEAAALLRQQASQRQSAWQGFRTFTVSQRVREAHNVVSFYLKPQDGRSLPEFLPGQSVTLRVRVPGEDKAVERHYSLSSAPNPNCYRVTVKRVSDGKVSSQLIDHFPVGAAVDVGAPSGDFRLREESDRPAVLIASGIGVAPCVSMLQAATRTQKRRALTLIYEVRDSFDHAMRNELAALAAAHDWLRIVTVFNSPKSDDDAVRDFDFAGHVDVTLLKSVLPCSNFDFYISGPGATIETLPRQLQDWGVPETSIFCNAFETASPVSERSSEQTGRTSSAKQVAQSGTDKLASVTASSVGVCAASSAGHGATRSTAAAALNLKLAAAKPSNQPATSGRSSAPVEQAEKTTGSTDEILTRLKASSKPARSRETTVWDETIDDAFLEVSQSRSNVASTVSCLAAEPSKLQLTGGAR